MHTGHGTVISPTGRAVCGRAAPASPWSSPSKANGAPELALRGISKAFLGAVPPPARLRCGVGAGLSLNPTHREDLLMGSLSKLASLSLFLLKWEITDLPSEECLRKKCPDVPAVPDSNLAQSQPSTPASSFLCTWTNLSYKGQDHKSSRIFKSSVSGSRANT